MSVNKDRPHVMVIPEDDANHRIATEFQKQVDWACFRQMQVLPVAGGWVRVLDIFASVHAVEMDRYPKRFMVLLIDFDQKEDRLNRARAAVPAHLADRVFVLGAWTNPEELKPALGDYEAIGSAMANDCREDSETIWAHDLLKHNGCELDRLRGLVRPILFPSA